MEIFNIETANRLSSGRKNVFTFIAILVLILSVYSNTFDASWHLDDTDNITDRKELHLTELSWTEIKKIFFKDVRKFYRPAACFTLALNYYFGETDVFGYHLVNISIHILSAIFLFLFIHHTLNLPLLKPKYGATSYFIALLATVLWAIHPVQTQAVTYIVQRMASMAAMFYIMAMYFYLKARTSEQQSSGVFHYVGCVLCAALAFGSKENAAMLPISILLFDLFFIQGLTRRNIKKNAYIFLALLIIPLVLALIFIGPSPFDLGRIHARYEISRTFTLVERVLTEPRIVLFYISLLLYPISQRLSVTHDITISHNLIDPPTTIIAILFIAGVLALCIMKSGRWPLIAYCIIFFFLNHLIEASPYPLELCFEHRNYLPSMLFFVPLAILLTRLIQYFGHRVPMQVILSGFVVSIVVLLGYSTYERNFVWATNETLWTDAKEKAPDLIRPYLSLGNYYTSLKKHEKALSEYIEGSKKRILNNKRDKHLIYYNIGLMHHKMGNEDQALENYRKSAEIFGNYADTHNNMGLMLLKKGMKEEALHEFQKAIRCDKDHIKAHKNLALTRLKDGEIQEALDWLHGALLINPNDVAILGGAGYGYRLKGSYGRACALFEKALRIEPHDPKIHLYIAEIYFKRRMHEQAIRHVEEFIGKGKEKDLNGYITGTYPQENEIVKIRPYKKMVLSALSQIYAKRADAMTEQAAYLKKSITELQ